MNLLKEMRESRLYIDGGMGSLLQERGLKPGELPETWNLLHPEILVNIHREYLAAGADILTTNTFGANGLKYKEDSEYPLNLLIEKAVENAREAIKLEGKGAYVALDLGPTGKLLKPYGELPFEDACKLYGEVVRYGAQAGADLILIETMSDSYELKAAILAAKENSNLPVFATVALDEKRKLLTGGNLETTIAMMEGLGVDALGINCGLGPVQMLDFTKELLRLSSTPIIVNPNAGLPRSENGKTVYDIDAVAYADYMKEIVELGATLVGGCCGTTPEHIRRTKALTENIPVRLPEEKKRTIISSYAKAVVFDKAPILIGERINPTGKSKFKQALREHDIAYVLGEGITQQENGAHVLDVNVGTPEICEPDLMEEVVQELQGVVDLPLQIDTSNLEAMERALRVYNGKALINSVNGKQEVMDGVFPLVKKYGGVVVALALDEDGIPDTAEGRIKIAKKIYAEAAKYGISKKDILIDGLCMTISSDPQGAITTLDTLKGVREELQGKTILGVSNISFGLPKREHVNAAFFTMAMQAGLNAAIMNVNSQAMMNSYYSYLALAALDSNCEQYIEQYGGQVEEVQTTKTPMKKVETKQNKETADQMGTEAGALKTSVEKGLTKRAAEEVGRLLQEGKDALCIINEEMIPALDNVGKGFEKGKIFLPQLLMSAEAAKAAFEVIKEHMKQSGQVQVKKGKIVLATVKGDIHDIGKNIVKVLLENYSYQVIDLGKDVPPQKVVETVLEEKVDLVGLSALMTTTVPAMEETIRLLKKSAPNTKVMVGGAVLTEEYARTIGANFYGKDAMASVNYAEGLTFNS